MNTNLFRSAEFYQRRYHNFATLLILPLVLLVSFLFLFSFLAKKEITVTSRGEITPTKVIASIQSTSNNPILANHLVANQAVKKGDALIQYAETMEASQKQALESQVHNLEEQKKGLETLRNSLEQGTNLFTGEDNFGYGATFQQFVSQTQDLELGIAKTNAEVTNQAALANHTAAAIDQQLSQLQQDIIAYEELKTAISTQASSLPTGNPHQATLNNYLAQVQGTPNPALSDQYISQINQTIAGLENSIASLSIQRAGTGSIATYDTSLATKIESLRAQFLQNAAQQLTTVESQLLQAKSQLDQAATQLEQTAITAPENGVIALNPEFEGKNLIPVGSDIAYLYPDIKQTKTVLITYYVTSEYVALLKEGQTARLSLEKIGNQPITVIGSIQSIAQSATPTEEGNLFKITAQATITENESSLLQYGLQGRVTSVIAKKTFFDYYKDKLLHTNN
ncbi:bacteriocin secretion accessory protein [Streptococcus suis]|uniref:bacteriocin secretion accessory protein n=1 Tax=Streptococcus suis TaxID=1307 RepID=UPI0015525979|nr:bacteriocin secretion accessory protein [Streptococcus suis]NQP52845.1 bacteriocin secretion accessory protein [Streptococcus suis]HEM5502990.1 bacteriocin secretion accessory protein [Streptococcus suis]